MMTYIQLQSAINQHYKIQKELPPKHTDSETKKAVLYVYKVNGNHFEIHGPKMWSI